MKKDLELVKFNLTPSMSFELIKFNKLKKELKTITKNSSFLQMFIKAPNVSLGVGKNMELFIFKDKKYHMIIQKNNTNTYFKICVNLFFLLIIWLLSIYVIYIL